MKRLIVLAFPCCPVSTQPFRDLLLMWKLAQPQCSFILDFCFVNTSYVAGDMTWTSYLSPSPSSNHTGSLIWFPSGYYIAPKAQYSLFSYCWWELEPSGKPESGPSSTSPQHHHPSRSTVAMRCCPANQDGATEGTKCSDTSAFTWNVQPGCPMLRWPHRSKGPRCLS